MDALKERKNRYFLVSAIGALIALLSFLLFPFVTWNIRINASVVSLAFAFPLNATFISQQAAAIWLCAILALGALIVSCLLIYRSRPFGGQTPVETQTQWGLYGLAGAGVLALIIQFIVVSNLGSSIKSNPSIFNALNSIDSSSSSSSVNSLLTSITDSSASYNIGAWLFLLGMLAVIVGAGIEILQRNPRLLQSLSPQPGSAPNPYQGQPGYPPAYPPQGTNPYPPQTPSAPQQPGSGYSYPPQTPSAPQQPGSGYSYPPAPQPDPYASPQNPGQQPPADYR
ncbi:hypothetical protein KSC_055260 [Ktedonobacter sp. SOSP1-52]|uniref:DUF3824 domain-containing protein n=1 Tax=Ktedonobacter sp. SOSP1-52 TaxID=2778366 RepID=UPI0019164B9E|nr:DUF3824 domain-containing protein [Ktedonobacter sp. SOSP1-52]GHO66634.1 hypothetical protein KSC_055260 [Ktedonobacter sp. SOSP1-52]